ncbi:hypothetical protein DFJ74DRAFT_672829 [Hyaloraphidium curvatum]|nr:hypothetical protein DFJ74DRAFT_672829 [Hyaloraphidium curvatum]
MTMWELLSRGQKPLWSALQAYGAEAFGERVRTDPKFRPPRPYACPDATWDLITRCWAMDAAARPRFEEIADELKAILDGM